MQTVNFVCLKGFSCRSAACPRERSEAGISNRTIEKMNTKVDIKWNGNMVFVAKVAGFSVQMDAAPEVGGREQGPRPKPLTLAALGGCTGIWTWFQFWRKCAYLLNPLVCRSRQSKQKITRRCTLKSISSIFLRVRTFLWKNFKKR